MDRADQQRVEQFLGKRLDFEDNERANYQGFFIGLCGVVGVEGPPLERIYSLTSLSRAIGRV